MPAFWKFNWLRSLVSGNPISKLPLKTKPRRRHLALETLEERVTPASFRYEAPDATPLTLWLDSGRLQLVDTDDLSVLADYALGDVDDLTIAGNGFDVTLTLDASVPTVPGGIIFEGGSGANTLIGPVTDTTWNITGADAGYLNSVGYFSFDGVENLTGADNNEDTFIFTVDGSISGIVDGGAGGTDTIIGGGADVNAVNMEMSPSVSIGTADVVIDLSKYSSGVVRLDPDKVRIFRPSPGMITVESEDGGFTSETFADPTNSLTIKTGFNAKGTDEHIYVDALGTFNAKLVLDTGSTNKNNDGPDTILFRGNVNTVGNDLEATAETITVQTGVAVSTSNPAQAGAITFTGWDITLNTNSQLLAEGATKATSGAIVIDAIDNNAYFTPFVNVDISDVSITVQTGAIIRGGDVTMQAVADNQHILSLDEFTDSSTAAKIGLIVTDILAQAIEGLTQIGAGVSYSEANAKIDIQGSTTIDAQNLIARSAANASAITAPITFLVGPALGIALTDATVTVAGTVTTTGNATFQTSTDHAVNVFSDTSGLAGAAAALAVSVIKSNATAQVTDDANLTVGGDLTVVSSTIDRNRTSARSNANADGSVGIAITVAVEIGDTNAYLDGTADVAGSIVVGATQQKLPVPNSKLFVLPNWGNGVAAQAGVGENTTGDFLDDQKAAAISQVSTPVKNWAIARYNQWKGKANEAGDNSPPLPVSVAAAISVAIDTNNVSARIGDGDADGDDKNGNVEAGGTIDVTTQINNRPDITASSSAKFDSGAQLPNDTPANENNKFAGAFALGVGIYNNNASSVINAKAEVDAQQKLTVKAETLNDYEFTYGVNLITPFLDEPKYTTDDGTQSVEDGDIVEIKDGFDGQGHVGNWYLYHGPTRTINLNTENFLNTGSWLDQGGRIGKTAKGFLGNLTNYLNDNFGLDNNAVDSWSQAVAGGDTDVAVAGSIMFVQMDHVADALIKDSAKINQDANLRTTTQDVAVEATSANDAVNFGGNIQLPGLVGNNQSFKINVNKPGSGSSTNNGKGAVGFTFQMYDYSNQVTAKIEDGVLLHATSLEVDAETRGMSIVVGASGGKSNGVAFNGAFAVNLIDNDTIAQIANGALIDVGAGAVADPDANGAAVFVDATDTTYAIIIVGGVAVSDHIGIGATVGINIVDRLTEAIIGNQADDMSLDTRRTFTAGGDVKLNAKNDGFVGAFAVSGSSTSSNSNTAPQGQTGLRQNGSSSSTDDPGKLPNNQSNYDAVIKELKMKFGETEQQADDANSAGNNKGKAGISISGAVSLSVVDDDARAYVRNTGAFTVNSGQLFISANNNTSIGSLAGAVALALGGGTGENRQLGIAGAVGIDLMSGTTDAFVDGPTSITADGVTMDATRTGYIVSLTAGVSGAVGRQGIAIGGSVAVMRTVNTTETGLRNTTGTINGPINLTARDDSTIILIAGAGGFGGQAGVGAAVAFSEIQNTVRSEIENVQGDALNLIPDFKHTGAIGLTATADGAIIAIAGTAGVGTQGSSGGGAGTIAINFIDNTIEAQILDTRTTSDSTGNITLHAEDDSLIVSIAGAVGVGQTGAIGAALGFNFISNALKAVIENSNLTTDGGVSLTADSNATIGGVAIGVAVGTGSGFALEGSVEVNTIVNTIDAHITDSTVNADGAVTIRAVDQALLISVSGGVAASVSGSGGGGAAISYNRISNGVAAYIDDSTVESHNSFVSLSANSTPLLIAVAAAGAGGKSIGGAGTLTINSIANTIDAHITDSTIDAFTDVSVRASEAASMYVAALAGAGAVSGGAIGASIAYNFVGGPEPGDPNIISYNDGVVEGTKMAQVENSDTTETSNVSAFIDNSAVTAGGKIIVVAGFDDPAASANPGPLAAATKTFNPSTAVTVTSSTISFSAPHGFTTGDQVVYYKGATGNNSLGGLVDGKVYFVIKVDGDTIKLASTQAEALEGEGIEITSTGTGTGHTITALDFANRLLVDPSAQRDGSQIAFSDPHNLTNLEPVVYHKGDASNTAIGGLTDGQVYYVIRDSDKRIKLALTPTNAGNGLFLPLFSNGTGDNHSLTPLGAAKTLSSVVVANPLEDQISFADPHNLNTGDALVYHNGGGTSIGGLVDGQTYYVIKVDNTHIKLAETHSDTQAATPRPIFFTSQGTGTNHSLVIKPSQTIVNGIVAPLPISIGGQITSVTAAGAGSQNIGGAGAVALNFVRMKVDAHISNAKGASDIDAGGDVIVQANDTSHINAGTGSLGISTSSGVAVNASVGFNDIRNSVKAYIEGADVASSSGAVTVSAVEEARIISVVIGGAVAAGQGGLAFGGSFAINLINNTVDAHISGNADSGASDIDADGTVTVSAHDTASIATLAGNISLSIGGVGAVGIAFAVNEVNDSVTATIDNATVSSNTGDIIVDATFAKPDSLPAGLDVQIAAMAVSGGGASDIAGAGSVALNWVRNTVEAKISNVTNSGPGDEISAAGDIRVTASDSSTINALAGAIAISGIGAKAASGAIGASVSYNYLGGDPNDVTPETNNVVRASIENVAGGIRADQIEVSADYTGQINNITVAGAAAGTFALGGAVSLNYIRNTADAHISGAADLNTTKTGADSVKVRAEDDATIQVLAGGIGLAIATTTPVGIAAGVSVAENEIANTIQAYVTNSKVTSAGNVEVSAESTSAIKALTIGVAVGVTTGGGGLAGSGAGAGSGNYLTNTIQAYISASPQASNKGVFATGQIIVSATDTPTILAAAGGFGFAGAFGGGGGVGVSVGISVAINEIENAAKAYIDGSTVRATGGKIDVVADETAEIKALTIGGAVGVSGGGGGGVGVGAAGAGSGNTVKNDVFAYIKGSNVSTITSGNVKVSATDSSSITANGGGVGIGVAIGGSGGGAVSLGVGAADNLIQNEVKAYIESSTVTAAGGIQILADETATIETLAIGGAVAVAAGGNGGVSGSVAGAASFNDIDNTVWAYITSSSTVTASGGAVQVKADDSSTIEANAGGVGIAVGIGASPLSGAASGAVGFAVAHNEINNSVLAYVQSSTVSAAANNIELAVTETATIDALSIGGAVAVAGAGLGAASGAGAGADSKNTVANTVQAYALSSSLTTTTSGNILITATDSADTNADAVAVSISIAASAIGTASIAIGAGIANNDIANTISAYSDSSTLNSAGAITVTAGSTATVDATSVAASVSAAISLAGLALSGAGADSDNTVNNTISAYIKGASALSKSTITAAGAITVTATESATIDSEVVAATVTVGLAGGSVGISLASNEVTSTITAYTDNANVTSNNGGISISASATDTVTTLSVATSVAVTIGASGAGGDATSNVSPTVSAYAGSGATLNAADNITVSATTNNSSQAESAGASGGLLAIGTSTTDAQANGSVTAHIDGVVTGADNLTVTAAATNTSDALAVALAGGIIAGAGARADATTSPTVSAYTGNGNITARQAMIVTATVTPRAVTQSFGIAVSGGISVGASLAYATVNPEVSAYVGGAGSTINAASLSIVASQLLPGAGESAEAHAVGASGGVLAGISGSEAKAINGTADDQATYRAYVADGTTLNITGSTAISVNSNSKQNALSDNYNLGLLAAGAGGSYANSNTVNEAYLGNNVSLTGHSLSISATGVDNNFAEVRAGSGGAVAGAGAKADTNTISSTKAQIRNGDGVKKIDLTGGTTGTLQIAADHTAKPNARVLVLAGGVLAGAGAESLHTVNSTVEASIGADAIVWAKDVNLSAVNHVSKPALPDYENALDSNKTGPNILGATGGLASAAGAVSTTTITFDTQVKIGAGADVQVKGNPASPGGFVLAALNDIQASDKVTLGTGGAISGAGGFSTIQTDGDLAKVDIGQDANLSSIGGITMSARGQGTVFAGVAVDTFGVGTVGVAKTLADIRPDNQVSIGADATVHADGDLRISAGTDTDFNRDQYTVEARTDSFAGSLIPIDSVAAKANLIQSNTITVNDGALLETARNAYLHAERLGFANMTAYAKATSWVSAIGDAINGQSFDDGEVNTLALAKVQMDGTIRTGIAREKTLILDSWNSHPVSGPPTVSASTNVGNVGYTVTQEPLQSSLLQELANAQHQLDVFSDSGNTTLINFYTNEVNRLTALLQEQGLLDQPTSPNGTPPPQPNQVYVMTVTLDDIWAQAGIIDVRTDVLLGDGLFDSPGDAKVIIHNSTPAFLRIKRITIPQTNGGVFFNGNPTSSALVDDFNHFEAGQPIMLPNFQPFALPGVGIPPVVEIKNTFNPLIYSDPNFPDDVYPPPDISVIGSFEDTILRGIDNLSGNVSLVIEGGKGNININAPVRARNLSVITGGDVNISGVTDFSIGGEALSQWKTVSDLKADDEGNANVQAAIAAILAQPLGANSTVQIATVNQGVQPASNVINGVPTGIRHSQAISLPYATGGSFTLTFAGQTTAAIPYNTDAPTLQARLNALSGATGVVFSVTGDGSRGNPFIATVTNNFNNYAQMTANVANLIGNVSLYGDRITISAEYLNVNGIMQSGKPDYVLNIGTATTAEINQLKAAGVPGLHVLKTASNPDFVVRYDYNYDRIQVEEIQVSGGYIEIHGHVINTGKGEIRLLGGYGNITINNTTSYDVVIKRLDASQSGAGKLIIQDSAKGAAYITLYEKAGNTVTRTIDDGSGPQVSTVGNDSVYSPQSGYRYGWSISQEQYTRKYKTTGSSTWLGIDDLAKDPDSIQWDSVEQIGQPVLVGEGPYYFTGTGGDYTFAHNLVNVVAPRYYTINEHTETSWYGKKTYYSTLVEETKNADIYTHTIRADRDINVKFLGYSEATVSVTSSAGILLDGPILNTSGVTTLTAAQEIEGLRDGATVGGRRVVLSAGTGIGALGAVETNVADTAPFDFSSVPILVGLGTGERVKLAAGYAGGGTPGAIYRYLGATANLDLGAENYADAARWELATGSAFKYTTDASKTRIVPGNQVLVVDGHTAGGVTGVVYRYKGTQPALVNLSAENFGNTTLWETVQFYSSFKATSASGVIQVSQLTGDLPIDVVSAGPGAAVNLTAAGDIRVAQLGASTFASGAVGNTTLAGSVNLTSTSGGIGASGRLITIYSGTLNKDTVSLAAQNSIYVTEGVFSAAVKAANPSAGDLRLKKAISASPTGVVHIEVPDGALIDANNNATVDERTTEQLATGIWRDLGLTNETPLLPGDTVQLAPDYAGGGTPGAVYRYKGDPATLLLGEQDYTNTTLWELTAETFGKYSTEPAATSKVNDTIDSFIGQKNAEYNTYWSWRTQQAHDDAIGLADNQVYYVVVDPSNPNRIMLARTRANATAAAPILIDITPSPTLGADHSFQFVPPDNLNSTGPITGTGPLFGFDNADVFGDLDAILLGAHGLQTGDAVLYTRTFNFTFDEHYHVRLSAAEEAFYRNELGYDDAAILTLENQRTAQYIDLNARYGQFGDTFDPNFNYVPTAAEDEFLRGSIRVWTVEELLNTISAGLLKPTAGTQTQVEDPNIQGHDVVIIAAKGIGQSGGQITLDLVNRPKPLQLTTEERIAFAAADRIDVSYLAGNPVTAFVDFADEGDADTITRLDGGDWLADGLQAGMYIEVASNSPNATAKGATYQIASVTSTVITLTDSANLQNDPTKTATITPVVLDPRTPTANIVGTFADAGAQDTITRVLGDWIDDGFKPGMQIKVTGTSANATGAGQFYTIASVTTKVLTLVNGDSLVDEEDVVVTVTGPQPIVTAIVIDQRDDVNVNATGVIDARGGLLDVNGDIYPQAGANVYLGSGAPEGGSETSLILGAIRAGDEVRIKSRPGIFNGAAAGVVNIIGGDLILESGNNAVGTSAAPITIQLYTDATLTARASLDVYVSQTNASGTAGDMNLETVSSDTAGVYLVADGSIVDALNTDTPKIGAAHINLTAGGGIGEPSDTLEINLTPSGTLHAVAEDDIRIRETSGNLNIQLVRSNEGDAWLRAAGSINDANATGGVDIYANNITLTSDFGGIGIAGNDLDIDSRFGGAQDGVLTSTSLLGANIIEIAGDLYLFEVRTDFPDIDATVYTAFIAAPDGSILNGNPSGHNVLSGRTLLFAKFDIGAADNHLSTLVGILQGTSTLGSTWVDNTGALDLDAIDGVSPTSVNAGGSVYINASSPVTISQNMIAGDEIVIVAHDDAQDGDDPANDDVPDHLIVKSGVSVASGKFVRLLAGDDLTIEVGAIVVATDYIDLFGDFQGDIDGNPAPGGQLNADPGVGSTITILGTLNAPQITIMGEADRDTILIDMSAQGSSITGHVDILGGGGDDIVVITNLNTRAQAMDVDGQEGADTYVVSIRGNNAANLINIFDSGTDGGADQVQEPFGTVDGAADTILVTEGVFRTGQAVMYHGPGTSDGVLVEGRLYFVVVDPSDPTLIQLATTYADATAATPVVIDVSGVEGTGHSLSAIDNLTVYGTDVADTFLLRASKHDFADGGTAFVAAVYGDPASSVERVNYNKNLENLVLDTGDGDDTIAVDDTWTTLTVFAGAGADNFQIGQIFKSERDAANAGVAPDDEFETVATTRGFLSNGVSYTANFNGGADNDTFTVFRNTVPIGLFGDDGDDNFIIRAFALEGSQTSTVAGQEGNDFVQYVLNAPVDVVGGAGHDTVRIIGTEFSDQFVITAAAIFGAGVSVTYTQVETLEIDAAEGNDTFYVLSTDPGVETILYGGLGSDTFIVGGDVPEIRDSANNVLFPATPGNHTMQGIATSLLILNGESSPGYTLTLVAPIMLPGETNTLPAMGDVVSYTGTGGPLAIDTMTIDDDNLAAVGIDNPLIMPITDPATQLVGKTIEISSGPGRGRFWLIEAAVPGPLAGQWTLTVKNVAQPDDAWGLPDATSTFAITHASPAFFTDETLSVDYATIFNDAAPGQTGVLAPLDTEIIGGQLIVTSTMLTGLGMATGIKSTQLENLDILLGDGDDQFTVRATAQHTATLVQANGGADLVNVGSTALDNDGNLDLIQGRLTVLGGDNPDGPPADRIYINDYASTGRMNYLITPTMVVHFDLPDSWIPSPPIANYDPPRPTFAGMDYDGTTEFLHIVGNDEVNIFNVQPSLDTQFHIDGRLWPSGVPIPGGGDYLHLDTHTTGTNGRRLHITSIGTGHWGFTSPHQIVTFEGIERFNHVATYAVASNGRTPRVKVYDAETNQLLYQVRAYEAFFRGGVRAVTGDVNHDGLPDLIVAPGAGRKPTVRVYSGSPNAAGNYPRPRLTQFNVFPNSYKKGVNVALGDINNDGALDLIVAADSGWVPEVKVFNGRHIVGSHKLLIKSFLVFANSFRGGVRVAADDINRDGFADIVVGTGPGTVSTVRIFGGDRLMAGNQRPLRTFKPLGKTNKTGVFVSIGDFNGDGVRDVTASADRGWLPFVVTFNGSTVMGGPLKQLAKFQAFPNTTRTGVRVASKPTDGGNPGFVEAIDLFLSTGPQGGVNSRKVRLAEYRSPSLPPTVIDRLFAENSFDGIYLG